MKRVHQSNRRAVDLCDQAGPHGLIQLSQVRFVVISQLAVVAVIHDREFLMCSDDDAGPLRFADVREEMSQSERVTDFMNERLHLLLSTLLEQFGIQLQLVTAGIGKKCARQHAAVDAAAVLLSHHDLEIPRILSLGKLDRRGVTPS